MKPEKPSKKPLRSEANEKLRVELHAKLDSTAERLDRVLVRLRKACPVQPLRLVTEK